MKAIDKDVVSAPNNPMEEGLEMAEVKYVQPMVDWNNGNRRCNASLTKTDEAEGRSIRDNVGGRSADDEVNTLGIAWREEKQKMVQETLCSPHGRKIIPHFIHLNNVK